MLLLVRPKPKLANSLAFFKEHHIQVTGIAPVDIETIESQMNACGEQLTHSDSTTMCFVFTSTEAAIRFKHIAEQRNFRGCTALCVGESTAELVSPFFTRCLVPTIQTSEGIVSLLDDIVSAQGNSRFVLIKGEGGRNVIKPFIESNDNEIMEYNLYKRVELRIPFQSAPVHWDKIQTIMVTSVFLLQCMLKAYPKKDLQNKTWIVPSERVKQLALSLGFKDIVCSNGATNTDLLGCVKKLQKGLI